MQAEFKRKRLSWSYWIRSKQDEEAALEGCRPDPAIGRRVVEFFSSFLSHSKGEWANTAFELTPWQRDDIIMPLFSWLRPNGLRRFRQADIWIAKKNGKSTLASGIGLYLLIGDGEAGAEVYTAAVDRDQASIVFGEAANMVHSSPELSSRLQVFRTSKTIVFQETFSRLKALSADVPTKEGLNASGLIVDELHAWEKRDLWDTLRYAGSSRRQPLWVTISTAGFGRESIGYDQYNEAKARLKCEIIDTSRFVYIAEAEPNDDWTDERTWRKANPNWGVSVKPENFRRDFEEARHSTVQQNVFRRYRLNQWTSQHTRWIDMHDWAACERDYSESDLAGRICYGALDLAIVRDTTAFVLVFPDDEGKHYDLLCYFWAAEEFAKQKKQSEAPYLDWARNGHITLTPGDVTDYAFVRRRINELAGNVPEYGGPTFRLIEVAFDPYNASFLAQLLQDDDGITMLEHRQGYLSMSEPSKNFERCVIQKTLRHNGHPVLLWHVSNVAVRLDPAGNIKPDKEKSTGRIDGCVAAIMGLGRALSANEACAYDDRGVVTV